MLSLNSLEASTTCNKSYFNKKLRNKIVTHCTFERQLIKIKPISPKREH